MNSFHKFLVKLACLLFPYKIVEGQDRIPDGGALIVSNHLSMIDVLYIRDIYFKEMFFVAKKELFNKKLIARLLTSYGGIPIDRDHPEVKVMLRAVKVLKDDVKLVIFPEGTRNRTGETLLPIKSGSAYFAVKSKKPIVPIFIYRKARIFRKTPIIIGEPFELDGFYDARITNEENTKMDEIIKNKLLEQYDKLNSIVNVKKKRKKRA